ncbi:MAG: glycosyltransferase [Coriobacteriaceae bacterium]|nr:glycosyltransferase [Coriobacteriaceae bacterium]
MQTDAQALVSVIVPTYNTEAFLDQCLLSIRNQTYRNLEIICVNDGSTDGSLAIMQRHAAEDPRVRIIDKQNAGYGAGCNRGIAEARGAWISIIEPDDWIDSTMYEEMLAFAATFSDTVDIIKTPWWDVKFWNDPERMKAYPCLLTGRIHRSTVPQPIQGIPQLLAYHPGIWSALYRKDFLVEHDVRFPEYPGAGWADNPFLIDTMCQARGIVYLDRPFYRYRADLPGSTLNHATPDAVMRPFDRWLTMLDRMEELGCTEHDVLEAIYARGFTYVDGAIYDDGADNPLVIDGAKRVFSRMDEQIVMGSARISGRRKKLFCEMLGKPYTSSIDPIRMRYVLEDARCYLRVYGVSEFAERVAQRITGRR